DPNHLPTASVTEQKPVSNCGYIRRSSGPINSLDGDGIGIEDSTGPAFQSVAGQLSLVLDKPVINKTGLTGIFNIHLRWADDLKADADSSATSNTERPSLFTALQEQMGLKLESARGPVKVWVVDGAQKPNAN